MKRPLRGPVSFLQPDLSKPWHLSFLFVVIELSGNALDQFPAEYRTGVGDLLPLHQARLFDRMRKHVTTVEFVRFGIIQPDV